MRRLQSWLGWTATVAMLVALFLIFCVVPTEAQMGVVQRIFYFHVPCALVAYAGFLTVAVASGFYLARGSATADRLAIAGAEVGVLFCTLVLVTGPIWARPIWGVWWTWDPRLTMTVILWAIYASYLMLRAFGGEDEAIASYAAVLGMVGSLAIVLNHYAVRLLEGIHPAVLRARPGRESGLADPWMGVTLATSMVAMLLLGGWLMALRVRAERLAAEVARLRREVEEGGGE
jgi:heme exporter protein C